MLRKTVLAPAVVALALITVPAARSAPAPRCLGERATVTGTDGDDVIHVDADETGGSATVNGAPVLDGWNGPLVVWAGRGDDTVTFSSDGGGTGIVCAGPGDDDMKVNMVERVDGGRGHDRLDQFLWCGIPTEVLATEVVTTDADSEEEGPCN